MSGNKERKMKLITMEQLCEKLSCARSTVYKIMEIGHLPQPVRLPSGGLRWVEGDVDNFMRGYKPSLADDGRTLLINVAPDGLCVAQVINDSGSDYLGVFPSVSAAVLEGHAASVEIYGETFPVVIDRSV
jgi:predicted DNA-binding transcriptional regulator AlpA